MADLHRINSKTDTITCSAAAPAAVIAAVMRERRITGFSGPARADLLGELASIGHVTRLDLQEISGAGIACLARMPQLRELSLSGEVTDDGLRLLLPALPELRKFELCWASGVSDAGLAELTHCGLIEEVNVMGTDSGDGVIRALGGKAFLRQLTTGRAVTDEGIGRLHEIPCFKTWQGGEVRCGLMDAGAWPTRVMLDGPFTDAGLGRLARLDGLFGVGFFWHADAFTSAGLAVLAELPRLGAVNCGGSRCDDEALRVLGALPSLRMLVAQGAVATDAGYEALAASRSLEYLWGRDFTGLRAAGFRALSTMPALRGLAVNCAHLDDAALGFLPHFPALRELAPMGVKDAGFRHVGACAELEALWCMYCRDTGDAATEFVAALDKLRSYYAGATQITDRSLEILGRMQTLERIELWKCLGVTPAGVQHLKAQPNLRELVLGDMPGIAD